jgi:hypothetical protein
MVTNRSKTYGPHHFQAKLIPHMIIKGLAHETLPVYGDGMNVRDWLFVEDHANALAIVLERGLVAETYNVGGRNERTNLHVVHTICDLLDTMEPSPRGSRRHLIGFVTDRPGHDRRLDAAKLERELGRRALETFETGLEKTVASYLAHPYLVAGDPRPWLPGRANRRHRRLDRPLNWTSGCQHEAKFIGIPRIGFDLSKCICRPRWAARRWREQGRIAWPLRGSRSRPRSEVPRLVPRESGSLPQLPGYDNWIDLVGLPPSGLVTVSVERPMVTPAQRHGVFVADPAAEGSRLHEAQVMGVRGPSRPQEAGLQTDELEVLAVAIAARLAQRGGALVDVPGRGVVDPRFARGVLVGRA